MKVSNSEGAANHTAPESWRVGRETYLQALTGECAGWALSRESYRTGCRRRSLTRKATSVASPSRDVTGPGEVEDPTHARKHLARNPGDPGVGHAPSARSARRIRQEYGRDERRQEVGQAHSTGETPEQGRAWHPRIAEGVEGRGDWPREVCSHWQNLDTAPERNCNNRRSGHATPIMRQHPRQEPGAVVQHAGICAGGAG